MAVLRSLILRLQHLWLRRHGTDGLGELIELFKHISLGAVHAVLSKSDRKKVSWSCRWIEW